MDSALRVVIAANDPGYLRLAGVALDQAGYTVITSSVRPARLHRLLAHGGADVLVLDDEALAVALGLEIERRHRPVGIVTVRDTDETPRGSQTVVAKWGPLADLVDAVALCASTARATVRGTEPPRRGSLRVV